MRPRREQDHRQIRMLLADRPEQRHALLARCGVGGEVHVLDHHVDGLMLQHGQAFVRRQRGERPDVMQGHSQRKRLAHGRVVVDDEYATRHFFSAHADIDAAPAAKVCMTIGLLASDGNEIDV